MLDATENGEEQTLKSVTKYYCCKRSAGYVSPSLIDHIAKKCTKIRPNLFRNKVPKNIVCTKENLVKEGDNSRHPKIENTNTVPVVTKKNIENNQTKCNTPILTEKTIPQYESSSFIKQKLCTYCKKTFLFNFQLKTHKFKNCKRFLILKNKYKRNFLRKNICENCSLKFRNTIALSTHRILCCKLFKKPKQEYLNVRSQRKKHNKKEKDQIHNKCNVEQIIPQKTDLIMKSSKRCPNTKSIKKLKTDLSMSQKTIGIKAIAHLFDVSSSTSTSEEMKTNEVSKMNSISDNQKCHNNKLILESESHAEGENSNIYISDNNNYKSSEITNSTRLENDTNLKNVPGSTGNLENSKINNGPKTDHILEVEKNCSNIVIPVIKSKLLTSKFDLSGTKIYVEKLENANNLEKSTSLQTSPISQDNAAAKLDPEYCYKYRICDICYCPFKNIQDLTRHKFVCCKRFSTQKRPERSLDSRSSSDTNKKDEKYSTTNLQLPTSKFDISGTKTYVEKLENANNLEKSTSLQTSPISTKHISVVKTNNRILESSTNTLKHVDNKTVHKNNKDTEKEKSNFSNCQGNPTAKLDPDYCFKYRICDICYCPFKNLKALTRHKFVCPKRFSTQKRPERSLDSRSRASKFDLSGTKTYVEKLENANNLEKSTSLQTSPISTKHISAVKSNNRILESSTNTLKHVDNKTVHKNNKDTEKEKSNFSNCQDNPTAKLDPDYCLKSRICDICYCTFKNIQALTRHKFVCRKRFSTQNRLERSLDSLSSSDANKRKKRKRKRKKNKKNEKKSTINLQLTNQCSKNGTAQQTKVVVEKERKDNTLIDNKSKEILKFEERVILRRDNVILQDVAKQDNINVQLTAKIDLDKCSVHQKTLTINNTTDLSLKTSDVEATNITNVRKTEEKQTKNEKAVITSNKVIEDERKLDMMDTNTVNKNLSYKTDSIKSINTKTKNDENRFDTRTIEFDTNLASDKILENEDNNKEKRNSKDASHDFSGTLGLQQKELDRSDNIKFCCPESDTKGDLKIEKQNYKKIEVLSKTAKAKAAQKKVNEPQSDITVFEDSHSKKISKSRETLTDISKSVNEKSNQTVFSLTKTVPLELSEKEISTKQLTGYKDLSKTKSALETMAHQYKSPCNDEASIYQNIAVKESIKSPIKARKTNSTKDKNNVVFDLREKLKKIKSQKMENSYSKPTDSNSPVSPVTAAVNQDTPSSSIHPLATQIYNKVATFESATTQKRKIFCEQCGKGIRSLRERKMPPCGHKITLFKCPICKINFANINLLILHHNEKHETVKYLTGEREGKTGKLTCFYYCCHCGEGFHLLTNLITHKVDHHQFYQRSNNSTSAPILKPNPQEYKTYTCVFCEQAFSSLEDLLEHEENSEDHKKNEKKFPYLRSVYIPIQINKFEHVCYICNIGFRSFKSQQIHMLTSNEHHKLEKEVKRNLEILTPTVREEPNSIIVEQQYVTYSPQFVDQFSPHYATNASLSLQAYPTVYPQEMLNPLSNYFGPNHNASFYNQQGLYYNQGQYPGHYYLSSQPYQYSQLTEHSSSDYYSTSVPVHIPNKSILKKSSSKLEEKYSTPTSVEKSELYKKIAGALNPDLQIMPSVASAQADCVYTNSPSLTTCYLPTISQEITENKVQIASLHSQPSISRPISSVEEVLSSKNLISASNPDYQVSYTLSSRSSTSSQPLLVSDDPSILEKTFARYYDIQKHAILSYNESATKERKKSEKSNDHKPTSSGKEEKFVKGHKCYLCGEVFCKQEGLDKHECSGPF